MGLNGLREITAKKIHRIFQLIAPPHGQVDISDLEIKGLEQKWLKEVFMDKEEVEEQFIGEDNHSLAECVDSFAKLAVKWQSVDEAFDQEGY